MATLSVVNNLTGTFQGATHTAKQGLPDSDFSEGYDITVTGYPTVLVGALATGGSIKLYDDDTTVPADPVYWHLWTDKNGYLQLVGATSNIILPIAAYVPWVLYGHTMLAAANTTDIASVEPTLEDIDHIMLGNFSGSSMTWRLTLVY